MTKEEIKANTNMRDVLLKYGVQINNHNRCQCFLHGGNNFNMGIKDNYCRCFVCGEGADVFKIVQHFEQCDFVEAVRILGGEQDLSYKQFRAAARQEQATREKLAIEKKIKNIAYAEMDKYYQITDTIKTISQELGQEAFQDERFIQAIKELDECEVSRNLWNN